METTHYICAACGRKFERWITVTCECGVFPACPHCGCWDFEESKRTVMYRDELSQYVHLKRELSKMEERLSKKKDDPELYERYSNNKLRCMALKMKTESFIFDIDDSFIRQIFEARYIKGLPWAGVAADMGGYNSADTLRITHDRYLKSLEKRL